MVETPNAPSRGRRLSTAIAEVTVAPAATRRRDVSCMSNKFYVVIRYDVRLKQIRMAVEMLHQFIRSSLWSYGSYIPA